MGFSSINLCRRLEFGRLFGFSTPTVRFSNGAPFKTKLNANGIGTGIAIGTPMEMLTAHHLNHLDDHGILTLILEDAHAAKRLLSCYQNLPGLRHGSWPEWVEVAKIPAAAAQRLSVSLEIGVRTFSQPWLLGEPMASSRQVFECFRTTLGRLPVEAVWVVLLDSRLRNMGQLEISRGSVAGSIAHPREILKPVILRQAYGFLLLHNHPSGDPAPSAADMALTRRLSRLAKDLHVGFLDHLVITPSSYTSFADLKILN